MFKENNHQKTQDAADTGQPAVPPVERRKGPVRSEVVYEVKLNGRSHRVSVAPAD